MSPSSSDDCSFFTIKSLRIFGAFTFLDFVQSRLTRVGLYFLLRSMMLKIYLFICGKTYVAVYVRNCMPLCVCWTAFARICVRLCAM